MMTLTAVFLVLALSCVAASSFVLFLSATVVFWADPDESFPTFARLTANLIVGGVMSIPLVAWFTFVFRVVPLMGVL